ncbi:MAG: phenylpyruvate tautomerase MIF-related protein [Methylobacter sp.]
MPYLKLTTNVAITKEQSPKLLSQFSQLLAKETGKPERYVMVELAGGKDMLFGGSSEPLAYVECKSIGLSGQQAKSLSASISQLLASNLQLPAERVYIEFSNCPADLWGWNGSTFG